MSATPTMYSMETKPGSALSLALGMDLNQPVTVRNCFFSILCTINKTIFNVSVINCGIPKRNTGVKYVGDSFTVNSVLTFECEPGYKMVEGKPQRTCQINGQWSGNGITCKCKLYWLDICMNDKHNCHLQLSNVAGYSPFWREKSLTSIPLPIWAVKSIISAEQDTV